MKNVLNFGPKVIELKNVDDFWRYTEKVYDKNETPDGPLADEEERRDLRLGEKLKEILEKEVGPEEGDNPVQYQNWDWNDDRIRPAGMLRKLYRNELLPKIQQLLTGEHEKYSVLLMLYDDFDSELWGGIVVSKKQIAIQKNIIKQYGSL